MRRTETPKPIWIKFCTVVDIPDVVTYTNFGDHWVAGGQISPSPIDFHRRPYNTLALPCERVICLQCFDAVGWAAGRAPGLKKNWVVGWWRGYLSGARCRLFWYWLTWLVLDKGPLNGCVCVFIQKLLSQFSDALIIVFWEKASERNDTRFTGLIPFVSLNQQCHSTERNTKHGSQSHSFFIHYQTPEGRDIAHFTLARWNQCKCFIQTIIVNSL